MSRRIRSILLVCNNYDSFSLEEDGRIEVQISQEYAELNLSNAPAIHRVDTTVEALDLLGQEQFDLVITMFYDGELSVFDFSRKVKELRPDTPVVLLSSFAREIYKKIENEDCSCIDFIFSWNNSTDLIIAIIKLLEDRINADHDILECGVQAIMLVEDSIRYYSTYLPALYKMILQQNNESVRDTLNEQQQVQRKRSRPKILMATNYTDAVQLYDRYKGNILGVISDVGFVVNRGDRPEDEKSDAGVDLCRLVRRDNPKMPFLMQSSQEDMRAVAVKLKAGFILKSSKVLIQELSDYISREFFFGDFVVVDPSTGAEIARARDLYEFEKVLGDIPADIFYRLAANNSLSKWLFARGLFSIGRTLSAFSIEEDSDIEAHRRHDINIIHDYRISQAQGVVAKFEKDTFNDTIWFSRLGSGSLGGKARGLAFLHHIMQKYRLYDKWEGVRVMVPRTLVVTTEYFDRFIKENGLNYVINSDFTDSELLSEFVASPLPKDLLDALRAFIRVSRKPLAVRSSSRLEDSYHQPFAGVYSTYMLPHTENEDQELRLLSKAVASVYASVYFASSKSYILSSGNVISEEKMAVVIQEVCGSEDSGYFFPTLSGVARSVNFYPVGYEKAEDGIVKVAYGLGKAVVDGEQVLRFSPKYPKHVLQTSTPELTVNDTQKFMYALSLKPEKFKTSVDDAVNLEKKEIFSCTDFRTFPQVASTWDISNMRIVDSAFPEGPKYVTFAQMLKFNTFPLAEIVDTLLGIAKEEVKSNIELEFAADMDPQSGVPATFSVLQIRPVSTDTRHSEVRWEDVDTSGAFISSRCALGTGWVEGVRDVVYLKRDAWDTLRTRTIAEQISRINTTLLEEGRNYVLIGFGRWGTSQPSLGVPVRWSDISEAKAIVECSLEHFQIDPSQGTHFFQNLTSFNVGYISVNPFAYKEDGIDFSVLDELPAVSETDFVRHVRFPRDLGICIDGRSGRAVVKSL